MQEDQTNTSDEEMVTQGPVFFGSGSSQPDSCSMTSDMQIIPKLAMRQLETVARETFESQKMVH